VREHAADLERFEEEGETLVAAVAERAREAGLDATTTVTHGIPHEDVVDHAEHTGVDLIVMGRTGAGGAGMPHLGAVTDRVLRTTAIPVFPV
jgi:nucleotide-binding universal stress UspA family protein